MWTKVFLNLNQFKMNGFPMRVLWFGWYEEWFGWYEKWLNTILTVLNVEHYPLEKQQLN